MMHNLQSFCNAVADKEMLISMIGLRDVDD